ncbi:ABC transporter substrate-binding protein [Dietzia kunjamensis]|uniref:ABC transporter substrate-binding protein n=1 Tax=Dietzia kunjamensis TaxID=322509 RepID=UPI0022B53643|nr:ABC transporter substrate-binding protein [Dietzia kunjamensis]MCZ4655563.1 ABC transporter substrate-binding protein [Dietzia kunjamensis]
MTDSVTAPRRHPARGYARRAAGAAIPLAAGLTLVACGPSPVDMVEHPMTTTPSRMAGEELQRSAEPEESCAPAPVPAEFPGPGDRRVTTEGPGPDRVEVPRSPERILALGTGPVDTACALGLQDLVVGTSGLPDGADVYLPDSLTGLPTVGPLVGADADEVARAARELRPDLIVLAGSDEVDPAVVAAVTDVAPTVVYDADIVDWTEATEAIADAYGRPRAGGDLLLEVIERAQRTADATTPSDTRVSLVSVTGGEGDGVEVQRPDTLGSLMLEAVGAERPPAQRTRDGERVPPLPQSPALGDELDGDVIFAVVGGETGSEDAAREVFASDRWTDLDAVGSQRVFVVDRAVWEGAGPVAARAVLDDIRGSINGVAPDG